MIPDSDIPDRVHSRKSSRCVASVPFLAVNPENDPFGVDLCRMYFLALDPEPSICISLCSFPFLDNLSQKLVGLATILYGVP
jgi:hypothetical protein